MLKRYRCKDYTPTIHSWLNNDQSNSSKVKTPFILNKVASLTLIRDIEVFEFSFLKSLAEKLKIDEASIYKFNNTHDPCRLLRYTSNSEHSESRHCISESKEVQISNIAIPEQIIRAKDWIQSTDKAFSSEIDGLFHIVYPIIGLMGIIVLPIVQTNSLKS